MLQVVDGPVLDVAILYLPVLDAWPVLDVATICSVFFL